MLPHSPSFPGSPGVPSLAWLALTVCLAAGQEPEAAPRAVTPRVGTAFVLPESPPARAWAGVGPTTLPAPLAPELAALGPEPWSRPEAWAVWADLVAAEASADAPDPARRAALAILAGGQGRTNDAWAHFARLTASPPHAAAVLPRLLPGVPADAEIGAGGGPLGLAAGVVLRPAPPPITDPERPFRPRDSEVHGIRIGAGAIGMVVRFESSGIEIEVVHEGGDPVEVQIAIPEPEGLQMFVEYTDWSREEDIGTPRSIVVEPGQEPLSLYGRFVARDATEPTARVERLPDPLALGGLWLEGTPRGRDAERVAAAAAALERLLEIPVRMRPPGTPDTADAPPPNGPSGITVRLPEDREAGGPVSARLAYLASQVEAYLLDR